MPVLGIRVGVVAVTARIPQPTHGHVLELQWLRHVRAPTGSPSLPTNMARMTGCNIATTNVFSKLVVLIFVVLQRPVLAMVTKMRGHRSVVPFLLYRQMVSMERSLVVERIAVVPTHRATVAAHHMTSVNLLLGAAAILDGAMTPDDTLAHRRVTSIDISLMTHGQEYAPEMRTVILRIAVVLAKGISNTVKVDNMLALNAAIQASDYDPDLTKLAGLVRTQHALVHGHLLVVRVVSSLHYLYPIQLHQSRLCLLLDERQRTSLSRKSRIVMAS